MLLNFKQMKLQEIKKGTIFTICETPSYPKLRTETGYIDMRDKIVKNCQDLPYLRVMEKEEVAKIFESTVTEVENWIVECSR
jgi:hypothetical protein